MTQLRSLIVLTGSIHVEGGETSRIERREDAGDRANVTESRETTGDRRQAMVIKIGAHRSLKRVALLKTPYGTLVDLCDLPRLKSLLAGIAGKVAAFNRDAMTSQLSNGLLWERLQGNRLAAVEGWIAWQVERGVMLPDAIYENVVPQQWVAPAV